MRIVRGINLTTSRKRASGLTQLRRKVALKTGVPTTKGGIERKIGRVLIETLMGGKR